MAHKYKTSRGKPKAPICPYCGEKSVFHANSKKFYQGRDFGPLWVCEPCKAWVGCHKGTEIAMGRLANKELRRAKMEAHAAFDPLWMAKFLRRRQERGPKYAKKFARSSGYRWLAEQLGISREECHIGEMDVDMCNRVIAICKPYSDRVRKGVHRAAEAA